MSDIFYSDIKLIKYAVLLYYLYQMFDFFFKICKYYDTNSEDLFDKL